MPNPKLEVKEPDQSPVKETKKAVENEFLSFLETPVQEFDAPDLPIEDESLEVDENSLYFDKDDEPISPQTKKESFRTALRYVKLFDKGFSGLAAAYSSSNVNEYKIDQEDQEDLADPLAELIAEKKLLDLPPSWALVITALIIYAPLAIKAVKERKEHKVIEKKVIKEKKEELNELDEEENKGD